MAANFAKRLAPVASLASLSSMMHDKAVSDDGGTLGRVVREVLSSA
jgi:hypothetical protein